MEDGFIKQHLKKTNLGSLIVSFVVVICCLGYGVFAHFKNFLFEGFWGVTLGIIVSLLLLGFLFQFIDSIKQIKNIKLSPAYLFLIKLGPVEKIIEEIELEVEQPETDFFESMVVTKSYVFIRSFLSFEILPVKDIIWVYEKIEGAKGSTNCSLEFFRRDKENFKVVFDYPKDLSQALFAIKNVCQWPLFGYNTSVEDSWINKNSDFVKLVDDRITQFKTDGFVDLSIEDLTCEPMGQKRSIKGVSY